MLFSAIVVIGLSIVSFSPLVFGDPVAVVNLYNAKVRMFSNDYVERITIEFTDRKNKNTLVTAKLLVKKTLPSTTEVRVNATYNGEPLVDYSTNACEGLEEPTIGKSIPEAGFPKDEFPQQCPFIPGDFTMLKWEPPTKLLPTLPDGKAVGTFMLLDGDATFFAIDFEATLKHPVPTLGR